MGHVARLAPSAGQRVIFFYHQRFGHPAQSSANTSQSALTLKFAWALADSAMHFCALRQHSSAVMGAVIDVAA